VKAGEQPHLGDALLAALDAECQISTRGLDKDRSPVYMCNTSMTGGAP